MTNPEQPTGAPAGPIRIGLVDDQPLVRAGFAMLLGSQEDLDVAGELITNICGALEVHSNVQNGMTEKDALNVFAQKVLGSIDKE